ncbi:MAG: flavin reductase family protein [Proteobacteria bacterium]|nr:flavin reductase family protein [Pseudomonadota bacterium]
MCPRASSRAPFEAASHFVVYALSLEQRELAMRFAPSGAPKLRRPDWRRRTGAAPLLAGCVARLQCTTRNCDPAGDHLLFMG